MAKAIALVDVLKRELKVRGLTYADVAERIGVSEGSVKRMFSLRRMSLDRMDQLCEVIGLELSHLLHILEESQHRISCLTLDQETRLVSDLRRLLVAVCVRNHWTFEEITSYYDISTTECVRHLAYLDRIGLIELLPGNRIRLLIDEDFQWLPDGPMERFFDKIIVDEFLGSSFVPVESSKVFLNGWLSSHGREAIQIKLEEFVAEFNALRRRDRVLPAKSRRHVGLLLAYRPWAFSAFEDLRRREG